MRPRLALVLPLLAALGASPAMAQGLGPAPLPATGFAAGRPVPMKATRAKPKRAAIVHERVIARGDKRPTLHAESLTAIEAAIGRYQAIVDAGGWPILPTDASFATGDEGEHVLVLRRRLAAEGDLAETDAIDPRFDAALIEAVKRFQARHGQSRNGLVSGPTLAALRVPATERLHALTQSARRLALRNFAFAERYVVVNIPSASVEAVEKGEVQKRFVAVVGKAERASPEVETRITNINLNPTWTVPASIIRKDIIPKMQKDPGYLAKAKIRIFGASGTEVDPKLINWQTERATAFTLRQEAGAGNALGQLRIDMPNREAVYMHDTPSKRLFSRDDRFHSSGCVRVDNVRDLAAWVLEGAPGWDRAAIDAAIAQGTRKDVRPAAPIPVFWTYLTGYVTPDGKVHFRADVYRRDVESDPTAMAARPAPKAVAAPLPLDSAGLDAVLAGSAKGAAEASAARPGFIAREGLRQAGILVQRIDP